MERKELTSGSTWHAAGLLPLFNMSYSVGQVHKYSVKFYQELQEETGMDVGFRNVSNIRLASTPDRMDEYRQYAGVASTIGVDVQILTTEEVKHYWPMCNTDGLIGAIRTRVTAISSLPTLHRHWRAARGTAAPKSIVIPPCRD